MEIEASFILSGQRSRELRELYHARQRDPLHYELYQSRVYVDSARLWLHRARQSACFAIGPQGDHYLLHKSNVAVCDDFVMREERRFAWPEGASVYPVVNAFRQSIGLASPVAPTLMLRSSRHCLVLQTLPDPVLMMFDEVDVFSPDSRQLLRFDAIELECNGDRACPRFLDEVAAFRRLCPEASLLLSSKYSHAMAVIRAKAGSALGGES